MGPGDRRAAGGRTACSGTVPPMSLERDEQDNEPPLLALHLRRLPRSYDHVHVAPRRPGTLHRPRRTPHRCSNHILLPGPRRRETRSAGRVCRRSRETDGILRETARRIREHILQESTLHIQSKRCWHTLKREGYSPRLDRTNLARVWRRQGPAEGRALRGIWRVGLQGPYPA